MAENEETFFLQKSQKGSFKCLLIKGIVQGGIRCGDEYLPGIFTRLTDPNILQFVKESSGMIPSK